MAVAVAVGERGPHAGAHFAADAASNSLYDLRPDELYVLFHPSMVLTINPVNPY